MRKSKSFFVLPVVLLMFFSIFLSGCGGDPVIAKYEGGEITEGEFRNFVKVAAIDTSSEENLKKALDFFIMTKYIGSQVEENEEIVKMATDRLKLFKEKLLDQLGGEEQVQQYFKQQNITETELLQFFIQQSKVDSYFMKDLTEEDKRAMYEALKKNGDLLLADVRHILISTENKSKEAARQKAEVIVKQLREGASFAKMAREHSEDPGSKDKGGLYKAGELNIAQTDPAFKNAVMTLPINKISDPIEGTYGYYIIRVEKRSYLTYKEVEKELPLAISTSRQNAFILNNLKTITKKAKVPKSMVTKSV